MSGLPVVVRTFPLGSRAELRVILDTFNGQPRVDMRTWCDYSVGPSHVRGPTKKGVSLYLAHVPALAVDLPRHHVLGLGLHALDGLVERSGRILQESEELRRVDLLEAMRQHRDRLPRPLVVRHPDALLLAVDLKPIRLVE